MYGGTAELCACSFVEGATNATPRMPAHTVAQTTSVLLCIDSLRSRLIRRDFSGTGWGGPVQGFSRDGRRADDRASTAHPFRRRSREAHETSVQPFASDPTRGISISYSPRIDGHREEGTSPTRAGSSKESKGPARSAVRILVHKLAAFQIMCWY